jgi:hypothetical protein
MREAMVDTLTTTSSEGTNTISGFVSNLILT